MDNFWTWGGDFFGYRKDDLLFTQRGKCVGKFNGDEIYGRDGKYLGEVMSENRLITNISRKNQTASPAPNISEVGCVGYIGYVGNVMYVGYEDFSAADKL